MRIALFLYCWLILPAWATTAGESESNQLGTQDVNKGEAIFDAISSHSITFYYSPAANVSGDVYEDDGSLIKHDNYDLGHGFSKGFRLSPIKLPFYVNYLSFNVTGDSGQLSKGRYQAVSGGIFLQGKKEYSPNMYWYIDAVLGLGISRFDIEEDDYLALAETGFDFGIVLANRFILSLGLLLQVNGYPTETIAYAGMLHLGMGYHF